MKIIYILSSGHSGSTVLGAILGNTKESLHIGEFSNFYKVYSGDLETCSCGKTPIECSFWSKVIDDFSNYMKAKKKNIKYYESIRNQVEKSILKNKLQADSMEKYKAYTLKLYSIIGETANVNVIIDSSKSPARAYALSKIYSKDLTIILITRNLKDVIKSYQRKRGKIRILPFLISQIKEHLKFTYVKKRSNCKTYRINYRHLFSKKKMNELLSKIDMKNSFRVEDKILNRHVIAGNRLRYKPTFYLQETETQSSSLKVIEKIWINIAELIRKII